MMNAVLAAVLALLVVACAQPAGQTQDPTTTAAPTTAPAASVAPPASAAANATKVIVKDFTLEPIDVAVSGPTVPLDVTNEGPTVHNIAIRTEAGEVLATTRDLRTGESEVIAPEIPAGSYILFCSLPGHESLGIKGTLEVSP